MLNVVVTGGSRGLGLAVARRLASGGYRVIVIARSMTAQLQVSIQDRDHAAGAAAGPGEIVFRGADLSVIEAIPSLVKALRKEFGPVYGLINNAASGAGGMLGTMSDGEMERLIRLNTLSPIVLTKYVARSMMIARSGRIINIASVTAFTGYPGLSVYSATKSSLIGFTRSLARELGPLGITVNAIAPGFLDTDMTQVLDERQRATIIRRSALKRMVDPEDVARSAEFLLSDGGRNVTGTVLTVDAGGTA